MDKSKENNTLQPNSPAHVTTSLTYIGPLPPAEQLRSYEDTCPGAANRIIKMAEEQAAHRQRLEMEIVRGRKRDSLLGIVSAVVLSFLLLIGGLVCILAGHDWAGSAIVGVDIVGLCSVFIYGTSLKQKENTKK